MDLEQLFFLVGIIYMLTFLIIVVIVGVMLITIAKKVEEASTEAKKVMARVQESKFLGVMPILPLVTAAWRLWQGRKKG